MSYICVNILAKVKTMKLSFSDSQTLQVCWGRTAKRGTGDSALSNRTKRAQVKIPRLPIKITATHRVQDVSCAIHEIPRMKCIGTVIQDKVVLHTDTQL